MAVYHIARNRADAPIHVLVDSGGPVSGATVYCRILEQDRPYSGEPGPWYLDWASMTYMTSGWGTKDLLLAESGTVPGTYTLEGGLNLQTSPVDPYTQTVHAEYEVTAPFTLTTYDTWNIVQAQFVSVDTPTDRLAYLEQRRDLLEGAIASGRKDIKHGEKSLTYQTTGDMITAYNFVNRRISQLKGAGNIRSSSRRAHFVRHGYR